MEFDASWDAAPASPHFHSQGRIRDTRPAARVRLNANPTSVMAAATPYSASPKPAPRFSFWVYLGDHLAVPGTQATPLSKIILTSPRALAATPLALSQLRSLCPQFIDGFETLPSVFVIIAAEMSVSCRP